MKNMFRLLMALLFASVLLVACGGSSSTPTTTVLVYLEGTNLESRDGSANKNITEMLTAASSPNLKVVLMTGAADKAVAGDAVDNWRTVRRYVIENNKLVLKDDTLGAIDMGDPKVLTDFITWGQNNYSADKYVLVFWDHGGGALGGFGGNDVPGRKSTDPKPVFYASTLSVQQLKQAVEAAVANNPKSQFELVGFDACLMATLEVAQAFKGTARYLAASQDIEPGTGWNWTAFLNHIVSNPGADGASIGGAIANSYQAKMNSENSGDLITFSVTNLAKIDSVNTALAAFSRKYSSLLAGSDGLTAWGDLASSRSWAADFSGEAVDMLAMFKNERTASDGPEGMALANATADAVVKNVFGRYTRPVSGLSVMFPTDSVWDQNGNLPIYASFNFLVPEYQALVKGYSAYAVNSVKDTTFGAASLTDSKTMAVKISSAKPQYEQVYVAINTQVEFVGADGKTVTQNVYRGHQPVYSTSGDASEFSYTSDSKWFMLNGKLASVIADPTTEKGIQTIKIPLRIQRPVAKGGNCDTTTDCLDGMYYLLWDFDKDVLAKTIGFVATLPYNQFDSPKPLIENDVVFLKYFVMPADSTTMLGTWNFINFDNDNIYQFTVGSTSPVFEKAAIPAGSDFAFFGFDLRWKQFVSSSVKLQ